MLQKIKVFRKLLCIPRAIRRGIEGVWTRRKESIFCDFVRK